MGTPDAGVALLLQNGTPLLRGGTVSFCVWQAKYDNTAPT